MCRVLAVLLVSAGLFGCQDDEVPQQSSPAATGTNPKPVPDELTHVISVETEYYTNGPQQGRPPDGRFDAGTKVTLLQEAGSYALVRSENGTDAYVSAGVLQEAKSP